MRGFAIILVQLVLAMLPTAHARDRGDRAQAPGFLIDPRALDQNSEPGLSADDAAERAQSMFGGRVLSVSSGYDDRGHFFRVKLLSEGRVRVVRIDAGG